MDLARLVRYPFLPQAADHVEREGPALEDLLGDRVYAGARERGRLRVLGALEDSTRPPPFLTGDSSPRELLEDLLSYLYARILVSALRDPYVVRRHALAEAVRVKQLLEQETDAGVVVEVAQAIGLDVQPAPARVRLHFTEFLRYATHLKDLDWKLVAQPLSRGFLELEIPKASRLIQEALRRRIEADLPKPLPPEVPKRLEADLAPLRQAAEEKKEKHRVEAIGEVDLALMPPCMHHILGQLQAGENASHSARFAVTSFLHAIGMGPEDIMKLFSQAPDFREDLTRYQVEHITGAGSGTPYTPPGCQAMQTFGICYNPDETCRSRKKDGSARVTHPLSYYRFKLWLKQRNAPASPSAPPPPAAAPEGT